MIGTAQPIWEWLRNDGGWHSVAEIRDEFLKDEVRERYPGGPSSYTTQQVRTAVSNLYDNGLAFIHRVRPLLLYRAVGTRQDIN